MSTQDDTIKASDDPVNQVIKEIKEAMFRGQQPKATEPFYHLIDDVLEKTQSMREGRSKTWTETLQKATFQRDEKAWVGIKSSFSIADSLTGISDEQLLEALSSIRGLMDNPDNMNGQQLAKIKQFADTLPSSEYKQSIDKIYQAALFCSLAMLTVAFPVVAPFTIPMMAPLCLIVGSAIMGLACHISLKTFMNHAAEEMY
jgi:hypothetical protein